VVVEEVKPDPEVQRKLMERTKEIYMAMPKDKLTILAHAIDFAAI
jgi:hypothetical protein